MNQKGFANIILVVMVVILAGAVGYFAFVRQSSPITQTIAPTPTPSKVSATPTSETGNWKSDAENTVSTFMENVNTPTNDPKQAIAFSKLTSSAQARVTAYSPNSGLAFNLAYFLGLQEGPDKGTSIISSEKLSDGTVKVMTNWFYSGSDPAIKTFILIVEDGQWKIDKRQ